MVSISSYKASAISLAFWHILDFIAYLSQKNNQQKERIQMLKTIKRDVHCCDICERESSVLTKCVVCLKDYCCTCEAIMAGCIHQPQICRPCGKQEAITAVVERFAKPLSALLRERNTAMREASVSP